MNAPETRVADLSGVSYEDALARAHALVPVLRDRASACETAGEVSGETMAELHASGLLRVIQPRRWGGMGHDYVSMIDFPDILSRGCMATGWVYANLAVHHWMLGLYDERAQEEVWGANPDACIASGIAFPQGRGRAVDGGIELSGHWNFSSAVTVSGWNMLACIVKDGDKPVDYVICLVPAGEYEVLDDWNVMGLKGTGSRSVRCDKVFVPEHRALSMTCHRRGVPYPGWRTNPEALFKVNFGGLVTHCILGALIGNAQAMFDAVRDMVIARSTSYTALKMRDLGTVQSRIGLAGAQIEAARLMARSDCIEGQRMAEQGIEPSLELKLKQKRNCAYVAQLTCEAVDGLYALAGANGLYTKAPLERIFRDQHASAAHIAFSIDAHTTAWGLAVLGGEINSPTL